MKRFLTLWLCLLTITVGWSQGWKRTFGGANLFECQKVIQAEDEGYYLIGHREVGSGRGFGVHVIRLDLDGNELWAKTYNLGIEDKAFGGVLASDGGLYVVGQTQATPISGISALLLRINAFGDLVWSKSYGSTMDNNAVALAVKGESIVITGYIANRQTGDRNIFIAKMNLKGDLIWQRQIGGTDEEEGKSIVATPDGYVIAGYIQYSSTTSQRDMYIVKIDENGELRWSRAVGDPFEYEDAKAIAITANGDLAVAGNKGVTDDFFLVLLDAQGLVKWSRRYPIENEQICEDIYVTKEGDILLGGSTIDGNGVNIDLAMLKVSATGQMIWWNQYGDKEWKDEGYSIIQTKDGGYAIAGSSDLLNAGRNAINNFIIVKTDELGNMNSNRIEGNIFFDVTEDCRWSPNQDLPLKDWIVKVENRSAGSQEIYFTTTDENGNYAVTAGTGTYRISLLNQNSNYWIPCVNDLTRVFLTTYDTLRAIDFPIKANILCPYVEIDVAAPSLATCSDVNYTVSYCNIGSALAENIKVNVTFDKLLSINSAEIPFTNLGNNTYQFNIGDLKIGECGKFIINAALACQGFITGQAHTVTARVDSTLACFTPGTEWDESSLRVVGNCDSTNRSVEFNVKNVGRSMAGSTRIHVSEEDVVLFSAPIQLPANRDTLLKLEAKGTTYRIIAEQSKGHPGRSFPTVAIEGCGTDRNGNVSVGYVTQFPEDDADPFVAIHVQENTNEVGTYMNASPKGYREKNIIERGKDIIYHIYFQNITNDLLRHIVIRDTLPVGLDITSIVPGSSSHPYQFEVYGNRILRFTFDNLEIPSINKNETASKGFVSFRVRQNANLPKGTVIVNRASVALNFQKPFITNEIFHTIGGDLFDFVEVAKVVSTQDAKIQGVTVSIAPNPFSEKTTFTVQGWTGKQPKLLLYDLQGRLLQEALFSNAQLELYKNQLSSGMYFYRIEADGKSLDSGKIIVE